MIVCLEETTLEQIAETVCEVDHTKAFLHSRDEPSFSCYGFLDEFVGDPGFHLFALRREDEIAGFVSILPSASADTVDVGPMYVRPAYQGRRLGGRLVKAVVTWARARGIRYIHSRTWGGNTRARRIFEGAGFLLDREVPDARVNGDSTVHYRLDLSVASEEQNEPSA